MVLLLFSVSWLLLFSTPSIFFSFYDNNAIKWKENRNFLQSTFNSTRNTLHKKASMGINV